MPREGARPTSLSAVAAVRRSRPTSRTFELPNRRTLPPFRLASATEEQPPRLTRYLYDGPAILASFNESGRERARYTPGPGIDEPLAELHRKQVTFYHADALGSILALTDATGQPLRQYHYQAFGFPEDSRGDRQPFRFTAREWDKEVRLYYYRTRYYDPRVGRFIQEDPIGFRNGDQDFYAYVQNAPLGATDPLGLQQLLVQAGNIRQFNRTMRQDLDFLPGQALDFLFPVEPKGIASQWSGNLLICPAVTGGGQITGYTRHGLNQAISRDEVGVSTQAILDAVRNPTRVIEQANGAVQYIGQNATVILNRAGEVITTWARNVAGWRLRP